jgi:hypothetical protein
VTVFEPDRVVRALNDAAVDYVIEDELTGPALARPVSFEVTTRHGDVQVLNRMHGVPPSKSYVAIRSVSRSPQTRSRRFVRSLTCGP